MKFTVRKSIIPSIAESEWTNLAAALAELRARERGFMPHELANRAGLTYRAALAVAHVLGDRHAVERVWCVYHTCAPMPVAYRPFEEGFQPTPWECPECEMEVLSPEELTYDIRCKIAPETELELE